MLGTWFGLMVLRGLTICTIMCLFVVVYFHIRVFVGLTTLVVHWFNLFVLIGYWICMFVIEFGLMVLTACSICT